MSPEQTFGDRNIDWRSDVWALGLIMYHCLSGTLPTRGDNSGQTLKLITQGPIEPLAGVVSGLPRDVTDLVARMLSREKEDRPNLDDIDEVLARHAPAEVTPIDVVASPLPSAVALPAVGQPGPAGRASAASESHAPADVSFGPGTLFAAGTIAGTASLLVISLFPNRPAGSALAAGIPQMLVAAPSGGGLGAYLLFTMARRIREAKSWLHKIALSVLLALAAGVVLFVTHVMAAQDAPPDFAWWSALLLYGSVSALICVHSTHFCRPSRWSLIWIPPVASLGGTIGFWIVRSILHFLLTRELLAAEPLPLLVSATFTYVFVLIATLALRLRAEEISSAGSGEAR